LFNKKKISKVNVIALTEMSAIWLIKILDIYSCEFSLIWKTEKLGVRVGGKVIISNTALFCDCVFFDKIAFLSYCAT